MVRSILLLLAVSTILVMSEAFSTTRLSFLTQKQSLLSPTTSSASPLSLSSSSTSLGMMFDPSKFLQMEPPSRPDNIWEVLQRLPGIVQKVAKGFGSSFVTGYVLAGLWGLLRGPVPDRGMLWGLDLACLSAIFSGTSEATRELFGADPGRALPVAIRNALLGAYFKRQAAAWVIFRTALFYGSLSYFVVRQSQKRQAAMGGANGMAELMKAMQGMQGMQGAGGAGGANMENIFKVMQVAQQSQDPFSQGVAPRKPIPTNKKENPKNAEKKANAFDVEWEAVEEDISDDPKQF